MTDVGVAGFAKGFATGFTNERNRRLDQEDKVNNMGLQYRLEALAKDKDARNKKKLEEDGYVKDGQSISQMVGDPQFAADAARMRAAGLSSESIMEKWQKGNFRRKAPAETTIKVDNPNLPASRLDQNLPAGVEGNVSGIKTEGDLTYEQTPANTPQVPGQDAWQSPELGTAVDNVAKTASTVPLAQKTVVTNDQPAVNQKAIADTSELDKYDEQVAKIAPDLLKQDTDAADSEYQKILSQDSQYEFLPDKVEKKIGTWQQEKYTLDQATLSNDKVAIADQKLKLRAIEDSMSIQAKIENDAKGITTTDKAVLDKNDRLLKTIRVMTDPDTGAEVNAATKQPVTLGPGMSMIPLKDKEGSEIRDQQNKFVKPESDYNIAAESTAESFDIGRRITDLVKKNPTVTTRVAGLTSLVNDAFTEVKAIQTVFENQSSDANKAFADNNVNAVSKSISSMEQSLINLEKERAQLPNNVLSDRNAQLALDKTIYENSKKLFAYKLAMANGQSGNGLNVKDVQNFEQMIGGNDSNPAAVTASIFDVLQKQKTKIDQKKASLDAQFGRINQTFPFDLGLKGRTMEEIITDPSTREFFHGIADAAQKASQYTVDNSNGPAQTQVQEDTTPVDIKINGRTVKSHTVYTTPSGKKGYFTSAGQWVPQ